VYLAAVRSQVETDNKAVHIDSRPVNRKLPITFDIMSKLQTVASNLSDGTMLWCAMLLAFFGCMRASEFTVNRYDKSALMICHMPVYLLRCHKLTSTVRVSRYILVVLITLYYVLTVYYDK
jgi:hypothetical protein